MWKGHREVREIQQDTWHIGSAECAMAVTVSIVFISNKLSMIVEEVVGSIVINPFASGVILGK